MKSFEFEDVVSVRSSVELPQVSVKGKLLNSIDHWKSLGTPHFILNVIRDGYKIPFIPTPPAHHYRNNASAVKVAEFVAEAISGAFARQSYRRFIPGIIPSSGYYQSIECFSPKQRQEEAYTFSPVSYM